MSFEHSRNPNEFNFTGPVLPDVGPRDELNYATYKTIRNKIVAYLKAQHSSRGGGQHGHIKIICGTDDALYNRLTNNAPDFAPPTDPGTGPNVPAGATQHQLVELYSTWQVLQTDYLRYIAIEEAVKRSILTHIHDCHYHELCHHEHEYANVSAAQFHAHFALGHDAPDDEALTENRKKLYEPHDLADPVRLTLMNKKKCQAFAVGTLDAISDGNLIQAVLSAFKDTGDKHFVKAVRDYGERNQAAKTWDNLKSDLVNAEKLRKNDPETSKEAGYANAATTTMGETTNETAAAATADTNKTKPGTVKIGKRFYGYCFTHGLTSNPNHTSATCKYPCDTHKKEATLDNMMGGLPKINVPRGYKCLVPQKE